MVRLQWVFPDPSKMPWSTAKIFILNLLKSRLPMPVLTVKSGVIILVLELIATMMKQNICARCVPNFYQYILCIWLTFFYYVCCSVTFLLPQLYLLKLLLVWSRPGQNVVVDIWHKKNFFNVFLPVKKCYVIAKILLNTFVA